MWADILEIILNIIEAITLIASLVGILYLMLNKFTHGLRAIFLPCGMRESKICFCFAFSKVRSYFSPIL